MAGGFSPKTATALRAEASRIAKAQAIIQAAIPEARVWELKDDEGRFPVALCLVPAADGRLEALTCRFASGLNAAEPAFSCESGWSAD